MESYERTLMTYSRQIRQTYFSVRMLAGLGVTCEFVPRDDEHPGHYGENPQWRINRGRGGIPRRRRERTRRKVLADEFSLI